MAGARPLGLPIRRRREANPCTANAEELFDVGREVVSYRTLSQLVEKASHDVDHPDECDAIARRGLAAVRERHTVDLRLAEMLRAVGQGAA